MTQQPVRASDGRPERSVLAVVVTYNRKPLLLKCLQCLLEQKDARCDILVVDNAGTDGSAEAVQALGIERIRYHNTGKNLGGAGGFNIGVRMAVELGYTCVWLMDDDTLPKPDALSMLMEADSVAPEGYGYLSSVTLWTDGGECIGNRQKLKKSFYTDSPLLRYGMVLAEQATFVSLFLRTATVRAVGLPISEFFIWGDDIEYTRRIAVRKGLPSYVAGKSQVVHAMEYNYGFSVATDVPKRISRYKYAYRNENYLYRQEGLRGFVYYTAKCGLNVCRILFRAPGQRLRRIGVVIGQYFAGLFFNPRVEYITQASESEDTSC